MPRRLPVRVAEARAARPLRRADLPGLPIRRVSSPKGEALWSIDDALAAAGLKTPAKALKSAPGLPPPVHRMTEEKGRRELLLVVPEATFFAILAAGTTDRSGAFRAWLFGRAMDVVRARNEPATHSAIIPGFASYEPRGRRPGMQG